LRKGIASRGAALPTCLNFGSLGNLPHGGPSVHIREIRGSLRRPRSAIPSWSTKVRICTIALRGRSLLDPRLKNYSAAAPASAIPRLHTAAILPDAGARFLG
jgi:hypothetical protein